MTKNFYKLQNRKVDAGKMRAYVKKYQHSDKGKAKRKVWLEANKEKRLKYHVEYNAERRRFAQEKNVCFYCLKHRPKPGVKLCRACSARIKDQRSKKSVVPGEGGESL